MEFIFNLVVFGGLFASYFFFVYRLRGITKAKLAQERSRTINILTETAISDKFAKERRKFLENK